MLYSHGFKVNKTGFVTMVGTITNRLLVLFPGALGDFVCFLPALGSLRRCEQVDLLANPGFSDLVSRDVKVRALESYEMSRLFVPGSAKEQRLRDFFGSYSSIFSWTGSGHRAFVQELNTLSRGRARVFPFQPSNGRVHQVDYYLACVGEQASDSTIPEISLQPEAVAWSDEYWRQHGLCERRVMAIAPGSGAREKNWPDHGFQRVADWWRRHSAGVVVIILGPVEDERGGYAALSHEPIIARDLTLGQLAALLARVELYVGNDSGVTHLAAALGVRTVALFGPSDIERWAPRGKRVALLTRKVECSPCERPVMKSCTHRRCLSALSPDSVIAELHRLANGVTLTRGGSGFRLNAQFLHYPREVNRQNDESGPPLAPEPA
jgi:ADP-heptose:LPS heptosyltransferase